MRRSKSVHTVRLILGLVAVSLSLLGAVRGAGDVPATTAQRVATTVSHS